MNVAFGCRNLMADCAGMNELVRLHSSIVHYRNADIKISCDRLWWMDAHIAPMLLNIVRHVQSNGNKVTFPGLRLELQQILRKNRFLSSPLIDNFHTTIPVTEFSIGETVIFSRYAKQHLDRSEMPKMTTALRNKIFEAVDELFENASIHSKSHVRICAGGQFYPRKKLISFVVSDGGLGIQGAMLAAGKPPLTAERAIDWALTDGNTTRVGGIPGGLGLKVLRDFLRINGGRLMVVSNDGYWCQTGAGVETRRLVAPFTGTCVLLDIVTSDQNSYDLAGAPNPENIW